MNYFQLMNINNKKQMFNLLKNGSLGNSFRTWNSVDEIKKSGYSGKVTMRCKQGGGGLLAYEVPQSQISKIINVWSKKGISNEDIFFNENAPDHLLLMQGELMRTEDYYFLLHSFEKKKTKEAMETSKIVKGLKAKNLIKHLMNPASYEDIKLIFDLYPDSVIEFSIYSKNVGWAYNVF